MLFSSSTFLMLFLPAVCAAYFLVSSRKFKNLILFLFSILFYAWGEPVYIVLIIISSLNDYFFAQLVSAEKKKNNYGRAKLYFILSLVVNLGLLGYFKYANFLILNVNWLTGWNIPTQNLPLPIGISFYTFQTMSYSIDVYLGKVKVQKSFLNMATYVALFPQLIAGPIVRYRTVEKNLAERVETIPKVYSGLQRFSFGLAKKVIIANQMGLIADTIFLNYSNSTGTVVTWLGILAYTFQIYFDFSGYSDMAIGLGRVFGFEFLENFNYPYISKSVTEFWRRWHISLSSWFRDYVYIPLGGNRKHQIRNIIVVWLLTGLWHGAYWNYVIWGVFYAVLLLVEKYLIGSFIDRFPNFLKWLYTIFFVMVAWAIFRIEDLETLINVLKQMFVYTTYGGTDFAFEYQNILYAIWFMPLAFLFSTPLFANLFKLNSSELSQKKPPCLEVINSVTALVLLVVSITFIIGGEFNPFIYFRF